MHGALLSTALISAGMLLYDWRMALALLWVVPASLLMVYLSRRMEKRHIKKGLVTRRAATDAMQEVVSNAVQVLGGYGYSEEYPVEKLMRDAKIFQIFEGSNQIQRMTIAKELDREYR